MVQIFRPTRTYSRETPRRPNRHRRHKVQMATFLPSTLGRCRAASVSVINSSSGPSLRRLSLSRSVRRSCNRIYGSEEEESAAKKHLRTSDAVFPPIAQSLYHLCTRLRSCPTHLRTS